LDERAKRFGLVAIVGAEILPAVGLFDGVRQTVRAIHADRLG
jgi:hypothetical protein